MKRSLFLLAAISACAAVQPVARADVVDLGTAGSFSVLAGSTVTNTGPSVVDGGDVGVSAGSSISGFPPGVIVPPFTMHAGDAAAIQAHNDLVTAYNTAAGLAVTQDLTGQDLGGWSSRRASTTSCRPGAVDRDAHPQRSGRPERAIRLPDREHAHHREQLVGRDDQRRPDAGVHGILAGREFRDAGYGHRVRRAHPRADEHHHEHRRHHPGRQRPGPGRGGDARLQQHHQLRRGPGGSGSRDDPRDDPRRRVVDGDLQPPGRGLAAPIPGRGQRRASPTRRDSRARFGSGKASRGPRSRPLPRFATLPSFGGWSPP